MNISYPDMVIRNLGVPKLVQEGKRSVMGESVSDSNTSVTVIGCKQLGGTCSQNQNISNIQSLAIA